MSDPNPRSEISFAQAFLCSAFAACFAEFCTIPLDTAKVRLQLQKKVTVEDGVSSPKYKGLLGTIKTIAREEGVSALWKGIVPGLHRQCVYGGLRIGLYDPVKTFLVGSAFVGEIPLYHMILAALLTGALAIVVANPTDLVKVRLQAEGQLPTGVPRRYAGAMDAYSTIVRQEGLGALWTGLGPNVARNAIINAAELASYDQVKQTILKIPGFMDNAFTHLLAGLGAGLFAVFIGSPVDVVKSRMMGDSTYKSTLDCFLKTLFNEGFLAFTSLTPFGCSLEMKPTKAEDNACDDTKVVTQESDDKPVEPEKHVHQTITEEGENVDDKVLDVKPDNGGEVDEVSLESQVSDTEWVCKSPNGASSTASGWAPFNSKPSNTYSLSAEEQAIVAVLNMQLKALEACREFLVGNVGSDCDEDDSDDEDDDELVDNYDSVECKEYKFFERVFAEDGDLRRYYENNYREGAFYCLVCGAVLKKAWKRFKDCVSLLHHSTAVLRTKRRRAHRAYAQVICKVVGWDINQLPAIVLKDLDNALAGSTKLSVEPKKPAVSHIGDSDGEPDKPADVHKDDSDVLQETVVKGE